jgi:hypothetical protein
MSNRDDNSARDAGTFLALGSLAAAAFLFMLLVAMVLPQVLGIVIVVGIITGGVALHYLVWGRWLKITVESDDEVPDKVRRGSTKND